MRLLFLANSRWGFRRRSVDDWTRVLLPPQALDRGGMGAIRQGSPYHYPNPQRSSPPDLGGELVAVVPALGLVRARNDCFIALDLDPGNLRLPLVAALLGALEQAHGHSPFWLWGAGERPAPWVDGVPRDTFRGASGDLRRCEFMES